MQGAIKTAAVALGLGWLGLAGCAPEPAPVAREAPEILHSQAMAGWDGRQTLGGLWAAHESLPVGEARLHDPAGGARVDVLLLRREAPGRPPLQLSSAAAEALGIAPGRPRRLELTALRRVPAAAGTPLPPAAAQAAPPPSPSGPSTPNATTRPPTPAPSPAAAPAASDPTLRTSSTPLPAMAPVAFTKPAAAPLETARPVIVATFAREENARAAAARLRAEDLTAQVVALAKAGPPLWQLRARPATPQDEGPLLAKVKAAGFADAYLLPQ